MLKNPLILYQKAASKLFAITKKHIVFLVLAVCMSGCYTSNKNHKAAHKRAFNKDMELLHKDIDSFLGRAKPSMLSE